jgi:hypothetical protein
MLNRAVLNPLVERIESRCCAPEIILTRHPLNLGLRRYVRKRGTRFVNTRSQRSLALSG